MWQKTRAVNLHSLDKFICFSLEKYTEHKVLRVTNGLFLTLPETCINTGYSLPESALSRKPCDFIYICVVSNSTGGVSPYVEHRVGFLCSCILVKNDQHKFYQNYLHLVLIAFPAADNRYATDNSKLLILCSLTIEY